MCIYIYTTMFKSKGNTRGEIVLFAFYSGRERNLFLQWCSVRLSRFNMYARDDGNNIRIIDIPFKYIDISRLVFICRHIDIQLTECELASNPAHSATMSADDYVHSSNTRVQWPRSVSTALIPRVHIPSAKYL